MFDVSFVTKHYSLFINSKSDIFKQMVFRNLRDDLIKYYNNNEKLEDIKTILTSISQYINNFDDINNYKYQEECYKMINLIDRILL